jgi:Family of unknown function (DUF6335)
MKKSEKSKFVSAGRMESEVYEPDPEVKNEFEAVAHLGRPEQSLQRGLLQPVEIAAKTAGGDIETVAGESAVGEESVGGGNPTPDQNVVEDLGEAMGLTYEDEEPLGGENKLHGRDVHRWEMNPASSEDFTVRQ